MQNMKTVKKAFIIMEVVIMGVNLALEVLLTKIMGNTHSEMTTSKWLFRRIWLSEILNFGTFALQFLLLKIFRGKKWLHPYFMVFTTSVLCTVIACQHHRFIGAQMSFSVPILMVVLFYSRPVTRACNIFCLLGLSISIVMRVVETSAVPDYDVMIVFTHTLVFAFVSYYITMILVNQQFQILKSQHEAEKANRAKSEFLSNMSHEIRSPINSILGMNEMILRECSDEMILDYAGNIQTSGKMLLTLISDILDITKIESGKIEIQNKEYSLGSLMHDCCTLVSDRIKKKGIEFFVDCDENLPGLLWGDEFRMRQIVVNLLTNAAKYTREGSVVLSARGKISGEILSLEISVKDTGIGIREEDIKKLFGHFQRLDLNINRNIEGTGLGLRISKNLAELMRGSIEVKSVYGEGSEFTLRVPQKIAGDEKIGRIDFSSIHTDDAGRYRCSFFAPEANILVVDDIDMNLMVFLNLLKQTRMKIDSVMSGKECVEKARSKKYDMIFIDHMMPGMDGLVTLEKIKDDFMNRDTPAVMLTANALSGAKEKYISAGFNDYLTKPVQSSLLEKMIVKYLPPEKISMNENRSEENSTAEKNEQQEQGAPMNSLSDFNEKSLDEKLSALFPDFDYEKAMESSAGSEDILLKLIENYTQKNFADKLEQDFASEDWDDYRIYAHSLKSSSRTIGLVELGEMAFALEQAAAEKDAEKIKAAHAQTLSRYRDAMQKLKAAL